MRRRVWAGVMLAGFAFGAASVVAQEAKRAEPVEAGEVPAKKVVKLPPRGTYVPARTPWGDSDITGDYNNSDESGIPFERPDEFAGRRVADSYTDRSLYDRCITRGIPGSMMPAIYGNSYHIHQSPGYVTITCHEGNYGLRNILAAARAEERAKTADVK